MGNNSGFVSEADITVRGDPTSRLFNVQSSSADKSYTVDAAEESCTCVAWSVGRNRAVRDGLGAHFHCKHVKAVLGFEGNQGANQTRVAQKATATAEEEKALVRQKVADETERIKRARKLKRDLKELREDV